MVHGFVWFFYGQYLYLLPILKEMVFSRTLSRIVYALAFCLVIFAGDRFIATMLQRIVSRSETRFSMIYRGGHEGSVVVLGNSRGVNAIYAPEVQKRIGVPTLNLSYNGLSMEVVEVLLQDYVKHNGKPGLVILEVSNLGDRSDVLNDLRIYRRFSKGLEELLQKKARQSAVLGRVSHLYNLNSELFIRSLYYCNKSDQFWINRYRILPSLLETASKTPAKEMGLLPENSMAFSRILDLAREQGIPVRLLISPYLPGYAKKIQNLSDWVKRIQTLAGMEFHIWDYSQAIEDISGFADRVHLNEYGSGLLLNHLIHDGFFRNI